MRVLVSISVLLTGLAVATGSAEPSPAASSQTSEVKVTATADAHVSASARRRNFGRARALLVRGSPLARAYVQFDLRGLRGPVAKASLIVHSLGRSARIRVRSSSAGWREKRINFANAPRPRKTVASARAGRGRLAIDVTSGVRMGSMVSFAVQATGRGSLRLASRETGRRPQLVIEQAPATLVAAGDIADGQFGSGQTAALLDQIPGTVAALGDLAYENGSLDEFQRYYTPTWGRHNARTRPAPGNHEYQTPGAAGYFAYWGPIAGDPAKGYYSYDVGPWHVLSLNSNCSFIGGCNAGSAQERWVRADLAANPARCTVAYWHHPRFSGGVVGGSSSVQPLWQALYDNGADLVLVGHAHNYQRFAPMTAAGDLDAKRGLRELVVGTGGSSVSHATGPATNLEASNAGTLGVLKLTLKAAGYDWQFVPVAGATFTDSGSGVCH